jgi:DNA-binding IclR family transcriptional regulator
VQRSSSETRVLGSALKCLGLLDVLSEAADSAGVAELARATDTGRGTVHQQLSTLVHAGWVEKSENGRYRLTLKAARIGHRAIEQASLGQRIRPALELLAQRTSEAVSLAVLDETEALIIQRVESDRVLRADLGVGSRMPLSTSASGRVLLAHASPAQWAALASRNVELPTDDVLNAVRELGYSVSVNEFREGIFALAAPVFDAVGHLLGALSTAGPSSRLDLESALPPLLATAREINALLAGHVSATESRRPRRGGSTTASIALTKGAST